MTRPLISEQQWAGGDRFAKTNNLISSSADLIYFGSKFGETGESHNYQRRRDYYRPVFGCDGREEGDQEGLKPTSRAPVHILTTISFIAKRLLKKSARVYLTGSLQPYKTKACFTFTIIQPASLI